MLVAPLLLSLVQITSAAPLARSAAPATSASRHPRRLFISPMGEPFRATSRDDDALADWFEQADKNHDGRLTIEEMQQDAERFFALLDVNHDGEIDPDEIARYESVVAPEVGTGEHFALGLDSGDSENRRSKGFRGGDDQHQGAARYGLLDLPEPVVSADTDFNRGVSLAEFRQAAVQRFLALDLDHKGYLTLAGLETIRPAPPAAPSAPQKPKEMDQSGLPDEPGL